MTCKNYKTCRFYCGLTDSCDFFLITKSKRPCKAENCPGYPRLNNSRLGFMSHPFLFKGSSIPGEDPEKSTSGLLEEE